jgi:inhibitor of KinA sporulation pathway (predicted exonuclease)
MEIIELGAALCTFDGKIHKTFSQFVRPTVNPTLSDFCKTLTHISQADVDSAPDFPEACAIINKALSDWEFDCWGSWGAYDFFQCRAEAKRHGISLGFQDYGHTNIKGAYQAARGVKRKSGLGNTLKRHDMVFEGVQHRALEDCKNIARILPLIGRESFVRSVLPSD